MASEEETVVEMAMEAEPVVVGTAAAVEAVDLAAMAASMER